MDEENQNTVSLPESSQTAKRNWSIKPIFNADSIFSFLKNHWGIIAVLLIVLLATQVRLLDYRWPYLRNIDSYNFLRDIEMIVNNGGVFPGTDPLMLAPEGLYKGIGTFYPYLGAYSYMIYRAFSPATELWQFLIWWPALLSSLIAIPAYFITKKLYDKKAGIITAFLIVFDVSIMSRTLGGDPDNDNIVLLLPLVIITAFIYLQDYLSKKDKFDARSIIYSVILGIVLSIWVWTWGGYWFVIWIMLGFIILKLFIESVNARNARKTITKFKNELASFAIIMLVMIIIMTVFITHTFVFGLFSQLSSILNFGDIKSETGTFPNVYVSVAELQAAGDMNDIIRRIGLPFFTTFLSIIYLLYSCIKTRRHIDTVVLLAIWFIGPMIATLVAVRFTIMFATPMAIGTGILFSKIIRMVTEEDKSFST